MAFPFEPANPRRGHAEAFGDPIGPRAQHIDDRVGVRVADVAEHGLQRAVVAQVALTEEADQADPGRGPPPIRQRQSRRHLLLAGNDRAHRHLAAVQEGGELPIDRLHPLGNDATGGAVQRQSAICRKHSRRS